MLAREHERRTGHSAAGSECGAQAAGERGLARAEGTVEHDEIAGREQPRQPRPERLHRVGIRNRQEGRHSARAPAADGPPTKTRGTRGPTRVTIS